jgi:hypothetical protein
VNGRPKMEEKYENGVDSIYFVVYDSTTAAGEDEVLQHKLMGTTETAHITLHPDGSVNFRIKRNKTALELAVRTGLQGYSPEPSARVKDFLMKVLTKI